MKNIEIRVLNPEAINDAEEMMVAMARLTQRGHTITNMDELYELLSLNYKDSTVETMCDLPHYTIQKFGLLNIAIVGLSRRALAQLTRHQNEIKFMSSSLQYSDYTGAANFVVPYEVTESDETTMNFPQGWHERQYLKSCAQAYAEYVTSVDYIGHDAAGYMLPQGLRGVLIMSATPFQLKHMIAQRGCNRNTLETQYIMLRVWEELYNTSLMFRKSGPSCMQTGSCPEGHMFCGDMPDYPNPTVFLDERFSHIRKAQL